MSTAGDVELVCQLVSELMFDTASRDEGGGIHWLRRPRGARVCRGDKSGIQGLAGGLALGLGLGLGHLGLGHLGLGQLGLCHLGLGHLGLPRDLSLNLCQCGRMGGWFRKVRPHLGLEVEVLHLVVPQGVQVQGGVRGRPIGIWQKRGGLVEGQGKVRMQNG